MSILLNRKNLPLLMQNSDILIPNYNPEEIEEGVVHFGPSDFERGGPMAFFDALANEGHKNWGVVGVSITSGHKRRDILKRQDYLYSVLERSQGKESIRVIGCLKDIMIGSDNPKAVIDLMASPKIKLVTMTITQKGYYYHPDKGLDFENPDIIESLNNAEQPRATVAYLVEALDARRKTGLPAFNIMSLDNMEHNGDNLKHTVLAYAGVRSKELRDWIAHNVTFFNTMVDRIVPKLEASSIDHIREAYGFVDNWPIVTEQYNQLVVGVDAQTRHLLPPLDSVGVEYVPDVTACELMKLRIFNGAAHFAFALAGRLDGEKYMDEALSRPEFINRSRTLMAQAGSTCPEGLDVSAYISSTFNRLVSSHDELQRIARNGSDKIFTRLLSPIRDAISQNLPHEALVEGVVDWISYMQQANPDPSIPHDTADGFYIEDQNAYDKGIVGVAKACNGDVSPMLALTDVWNGLQRNAGFVQALKDTYSRRQGPSGHSPAL